MAVINPKFKVIGPFSPKEFTNTTTIAATIDTAAGTLASATSTTSLVASEPIIVLGNVFVILTYT